MSGSFLQQPVARVEVQRPRPLLRIVGLRGAQVVLDEPRVVEQVAAGQRLRGQPARELDGRRDGGGPRGPDAALARELFGRGAGEADEAAARREQAARAVEGAFARDAGAQEQGDELLVREGSGAEAQHALPRTLLGGQVVDTEDTAGGCGWDRSVMGVRRREAPDGPEAWKPDLDRRGMRTTRGDILTKCRGRSRCRGGRF